MNEERAEGREKKKMRKGKWMRRRGRSKSRSKRMATKMRTMKRIETKKKKLIRQNYFETLIE